MFSIFKFCTPEYGIGICIGVDTCKEKFVLISPPFHFKLPPCMQSFWTITIAHRALDENSPSDHSRVLLHGGLQEALQDGPLSHGWSLEASTGHRKSGLTPLLVGFPVSRTPVLVLKSLLVTPQIRVKRGRELLLVVC